MDRRLGIACVLKCARGSLLRSRTPLKSVLTAIHRWRHGTSFFKKKKNVFVFLEMMFEIFIIPFNEIMKTFNVLRIQREISIPNNGQEIYCILVMFI